MLTSIPCVARQLRLGEAGGAYIGAHQLRHLQVLRAPRALRVRQHALGELLQRVLRNVHAHVAREA